MKIPEIVGVLDTVVAIGSGSDTCPIHKMFAARKLCDD